MSDVFNIYSCPLEYWLLGNWNRARMKRKNALRLACLNLGFLQRIESMLHKLTLTILLVMGLHVAGAQADDSDVATVPMISFNGFGTFGVVHSSENKADISSSAFKPNGAGYSHRWSADVDSLIAAQVTADFTPQLTGVVQIISEQNYDGSYKPMVEWAHIKYQFTPDFSIRIGRRVVPTFLYSENRKVGYTYIWVRPPPEVYRLLPFTSGDGIDINYRMHSGDWINTLQFNAGQKDFQLANNVGKGKTRNSLGFSNTTEFGALTTRLLYSKADLTVPTLNTIFDSFRLFGPEGTAIADKYDFRAKPDVVVTVGANYDPGDWFVLSEWAHIDSHSAVGKVVGWYVSGGYRYGKFTPYATYAKSKATPLSDPGLTVSALPPLMAGQAASLNAFLNSFLSTKPATSTLSIGGRWDFSTNAALKLQFDHTRNGVGSAGFLKNLQPGFKLGEKVNLFSATIDFVF